MILVLFQIVEIYKESKGGGGMAKVVHSSVSGNIPLN